MTQPPTHPSAGAGSSMTVPILLPGQSSSLADWEQYCIEYVVHARRAGVPRADIENTIGILDAAVEAAGQFRYAENYYCGPLGRRFGQCRTSTDETPGENQHRLVLDADPVKQTEELSTAHSTTPGQPSPSPPRVPSPSQAAVPFREPSTPPPAARSPPPSRVPSLSPPGVPSPSPTPSPLRSPSRSPPASPLPSPSPSPPPVPAPSTPGGPSPSLPTVPSPSLSPSLAPSPSTSAPPSPPGIPSPDSQPPGILRAAAPANVGEQVEEVQKYRSTLEFAKRLDRFYRAVCNGSSAFPHQMLNEKSSSKANPITPKRPLVPLNTWDCHLLFSTIVRLVLMAPAIPKATMLVSIRKLDTVYRQSQVPYPALAPGPRTRTSIRRKPIRHLGLRKGGRSKMMIPVIPRPAGWINMRETRVVQPQRLILKPASTVPALASALRTSTSVRRQPLRNVGLRTCGRSKIMMSVIPRPAGRMNIQETRVVQPQRLILKPASTVPPSSMRSGSLRRAHRLSRKLARAPHQYSFPPRRHRLIMSTGGVGSQLPELPNNIDRHSRI
jgi:hypothetical protein